MILTVSGYGVTKDEFANLVRMIVGEKTTVHGIKWQIDRGPQPLMDLLDTRDGKKVIVSVAEQVITHLENAAGSRENVTIISQHEGSRIVEEALSMVKGFSELQIEIKHIMLAPDIDSTEWTSIGKYATAAAMAGLATLAFAATRNKKGLATAVLGLFGSAVIANKETVSDRLNLKDGDEEPKFVNIERHIFLNPESKNFDGISEYLQQGKFYKGEYADEKIGSLDPIELDMEYRYQKWMKTVSKSKESILTDLLR